MIVLNCCDSPKVLLGALLRDRLPAPSGPLPLLLRTGLTAIFQVICFCTCVFVSPLLEFACSLPHSSTSNCSGHPVGSGFEDWISTVSPISRTGESGDTSASAQESLSSSPKGSFKEPGIRASEWGSGTWGLDSSFPSSPPEGFDWGWQA